MSLPHWNCIFVSTGARLLRSLGDIRASIWGVTVFQIITLVTMGASAILCLVSCLLGELRYLYRGRRYFGSVHQECVQQRGRCMRLILVISSRSA